MSLELKNGCVSLLLMGDDACKGEEAAVDPCRPRAKPKRDTLRPSSSGMDNCGRRADDEKFGISSFASANGSKEPV